MYPEMSAISRQADSVAIDGRYRNPTIDSDAAGTKRYARPISPKTAAETITSVRASISGVWAVCAGPGRHLG